MHSSQAMRAHRRVETPREASSGEPVVRPEPETTLREPVVRQDRYQGGGLVLRVRQGELAVTDFSAFGLGVVTPGKVSLAEGKIEGILFSGTLEVARVELSPVHQTRCIPQGGTLLGFSIVGVPLDLARVRAVLAARAVVAELRTDDAAADRLPPQFRRQILEMKDRLERIEARINGLPAPSRLTARAEQEGFEDGVADAVAQELREVLDPACAILGAHLDSMDDAQRKGAVAYFRGSLARILHQSPLSERIYEKPLGYAGDHEIMNFIHRDENVGKTLFAKCVHRYFVGHPNARAVRNRAVYLSDLLARTIAGRKPGTPLRVASVASGAAQELQDLAARRLPFQGVSFCLFDQDVEALRDAQHGILAAARRAGRDIDVAYVQRGIRPLLKDGLPEKYDVVYAAGLFDSLTDAVARSVAAKLLAAVRPGGRLVLGNFTSLARSRVLMELALDWKLVYRSESDLRKLYSGLGAKVAVESEPEGINLFAVFEK